MQMFSPNMNGKCCRPLTSWHLPPPCYSLGFTQTSSHQFIFARMTYVRYGPWPCRHALHLDTDPAACPLKMQHCQGCSSTLMTQRQGVALLKVSRWCRSWLGDHLHPWCC